MISLRLLLIVALGALLPGCGRKDDLKLLRVQGLLLIDGKPAPGAAITLVPTSGEVSVRPSGLTDATGKFSLTSRVTGDGAPAGEYRVLVIWHGPALPFEDDSQPKLDKLGGKYADSKTTPLQAVVPPPTGELRLEIR